MLGKVPSELIRANLATHPTKWARARPFHHMRFGVGDSMIFFEKKKKLVQARFWVFIIIISLIFYW